MLVDGVERNGPIGWGQLPSHFLGPFHQFEPWPGKDVPESGVFPLLRVIETVKVKMPDGPGGLA